MGILYSQTNTSNQINTPPNPANNLSLKKLVWIDSEINNEENNLYKNYLCKFFKVSTFINESEGINQIKQFKFEKIHIIVSGRLFKNFIKLIKTEIAKISCIIDIIVFTSDARKPFIEEICNKEKFILDGYFFEKKNIFTKISEVRDYLLSSNKINNIQREIFEKIEKEEQLLPCIYYKSFFKDTITKEEIHDFNQYLMNNFNFNKKENKYVYDDKEQMKKLIGQLENMPDMPNEIICKYWMRAYTLETDFYKIMNEKLQIKKGDFFCPYIKMIYEGIKNKSLTPKYDCILYRGGVISNTELKELEKILNMPKLNNFPKAILYYRSFQSFTLSLANALFFMNKAAKESGLPKVLFLVEANYSYLLDTKSNAYIRDISAYKSEDEVLFFPFSSFGITKINKNFPDHIEITLEYLGKYSRYIRYKDIENILPFFQTSEFGKEILELGLINYKIKDSWKVEKEINVNDGNVSSILYLENNFLLFAFNNTIRLYNIQDNRIIQNINEHQNEIIDLLKIENNKFISSSKDRAIKYFELNNNFKNYRIISIIKLHNDEVNQTIKLSHMDNYFASCSNDKNICIWSFEIRNNRIERYIHRNTLKGHESEVISIFELSKNLIVSASKAGFLKFWDYNNCLKSLEIYDIPLHHGISLINENIIAIGTNRSVIFVDFIKKELKLSFPLNCISTSYLNFFGNIICGLKDNNNSLLREYEMSYNKNSFDFNCIAEGYDKEIQISYIEILDQKTIITANKNNFIKIWKKGKPELPKVNLMKINENNEYFINITKENENNIILNNKEIKLKEKEKKIYEKEILKESDDNKGNNNLISIREIEIIVSQMKTSILCIRTVEGKCGTGFFCYIPFPDRNSRLPVLITADFVLNEEEFIQGKYSIISYNKIIPSFDKERKIYTNKSENITIIEIKEKDKINKNSFLEIDDQIFKDESQIFYKGISIYLLGINRGTNLGYSIGVIKSINENGDKRINYTG